MGTEFRRYLNGFVVLASIVVGVTLGAALYVAIGGLGVAVPIALLSLSLTAIAGTITAVVTNRVAVPPSSR